MVGACGDVPDAGAPQLRLGPAVGESGEKPTLVGEMVGEDLRDSIQGRSGESCDMEQSHPLPGGPWEVQEGVASRQSLGSAMGNPPALCAFPLRKGRGERGQSRRCLSPFPLVTRISAVPRAAGPGAVGPRAVGLLLLHLSRLQHALLRCRREVGESCRMGAILCPAESSAPLGPPCPPHHARSTPMRRGPARATLAPQPFWFTWRSWHQSPRGRCFSPPTLGMLPASAPARVLQALLWSMRSYTLIRRLEGHQSSVVSCDFSPDSALLVTASYDACVIMWDPYTGEQLRTLRYGARGPVRDRGRGTEQCCGGLLGLSVAFPSRWAQPAALHSVQRLKGSSDLMGLAPLSALEHWGWGLQQPGADTGLFLRIGSHVPLHSALDYSSEVHSSEVHTSSLRSVCFSPEGLYLATVADDR